MAALPLGVGTQRAKKVDPPEVRPQRVAEVELRVRALPQHEPAEPLLPRGTDHQIGIGLAAGVEVISDVLDVEHARHLLERRAAQRVLLQQAAYGIGDLAPSAVADRDVDQQPGLVAG